MEQKRDQDSFFGRFFKKQIDSSISRVKEKGHERLTIMVIPHGKESVISLQLNWSMIFFLIGTLLLAVVLAGYGFYWKAVRAREISGLERRYGLNLSTALQVKSEVERGMELQEKLNERLRDISRIVGLQEAAMAGLRTEGDARKRAERNLSVEVLDRLDMGPGTDYLPPIYSMRTFYYNFENARPLLANLNRSIRRGLGVYFVMPLGRPVKPAPYLVDTSYFGRRANPLTGKDLEFHSGVDMSAPYGTAVFATGGGTVDAVSYSYKGYGHSVLIKHGNGFYSLYAHLSAIHVRKGQAVTRNQRIGSVGRTGRTTGSHLHYEVRLGNTKKLDPLPYICSTDLGTKSCVAHNQKSL